jgi:DNA-binding CsgD family transcriptional regulator
VDAHHFNAIGTNPAPGSQVSKRTSGLDEEDLSGLIGEIYDCVVDPTRWEATLDRLRRLLECAGCALYVTDLRDATSRMQSMVGIGPEWAEKYPVYAVDAAAMMSSVPDLMSRALDEPLVGRRDIPDEVFLSSRYWREWAEPQGIVDFITLNLMRDPHRVAGIALGRFADPGLITDREVRLMRILAPHLRRAIVISDLIDMQSIMAQALGRTLDMLSAGVVLVAEDVEILFANRIASRMIKDAAPIRSADGKLSLADSQTSARLRKLVGAAARNDAEIGDEGIGLAITGHDGSPATAHVLPIAFGNLRSRLLPRGAAAVFVASEENHPSSNLQPVAEAFGLSQAETRVLQRVILGDTLSEAALALGVSHNTVRTHLSRIFAKTQTQRQSSLIALVQRLTPPVVPPGDN